ncbi:hypothetical protein BP5796_00672 [Coleophoma crateriformis]|uniref:Uncharacterized protein n=1 Tax=Coleophoma crateriformis TaxID=565419 RepID=A0A3D8T8L3_9HELO|nr:hypothetical protein BP5796_00672 [Coleophoma crateriformis]
MAPNIVPLATKLVRKIRGLLCCKAEKEPVLHYYKKPVPGIYEEIPSRGRYLLYMRADPGEKAHPTGPNFNDLFLSKTREVEAMTHKTKDVDGKSFISDTSCAADNDLVFAHDKKLLARARIHSGSSSLSWSSMARVKRANHSSIDLDGFFELQQPLHVQYCKDLDRWMFSDEIQRRTLVTEIEIIEPCYGLNRNGDVRIVEREFLLLDDACSWVLTGRAPADHDIISKRRQMKRIKLTEYDQTRLFLMHKGEAETLRTQTTAEMTRSLESIIENEGISLCFPRSVNHPSDFYAEVNEYYLLKQQKVQDLKKMDRL